MTGNPIWIMVIGLAFGSIPRMALAASLPAANNGTHLVLNPAWPNTTLGANSAVDCNGAAYGKDLNIKSCVEAQKLIPTSDSALKFGQRFRQGVEVPTPWRWVSADGKCVIEVPETNLQSEPQGSYLDLSTTADDMVELCLEYKDHPEGSLASNIGSSGGLSLKMMSYRPIVTCRGYLTFTGGKNMVEIMKKMSADSPKRSFGRRRVPGVRVVLPLIFTSTNQLYKSQLVATLDLTTTNQDVATWYDIWAATAALDAMCVRKGMAGSASWLGDNAKMKVTLTETPLELPADTA